VDVPLTLMVGCEPYGRIDAAAIASPDGLLLERLVDKGSPGAAIAYINHLVTRPGCDLGHGYHRSGTARTTVDGYPAVQTTMTTGYGSAQTTAVAVGDSVLALRSSSTPATSRQWLAAAVARMKAPRQQPKVDDVTQTPPFRCMSPSACAALDRQSDA
jgi:hypothetical protein